jgi:hypothetical protein
LLTSKSLPRAQLYACTKIICKVPSIRWNNIYTEDILGQFNIGNETDTIAQVTEYLIEHSTLSKDSYKVAQRIVWLLGLIITREEKSALFEAWKVRNLT